MLFKKIKVSKTNIPQNLLNNLNEYIIRIDYFNQKGTKNYEDNIPLKHIFNSDMKLPETNFKRNYS